MECFCSKPISVHCKIILLDEQELIHELQDSCTGQAILDVVTRHLNLLETAYFGLRYLDQNGQTHWLNPAKKLCKQIKGPDPHTFYFGVKFYAVDPCKLLEEITRYQFFLQVKQDILQGRLPVLFELAAELGAYVLQSELGDYDPRRHSPGYVSEFRFLSNQTLELETRIAELHRTLVGQLPSVAEYNYLDKVKWLEMYGVDLHPVLGEDNVEYFLGLTPSGIMVLRNKNTVGNYYWPRITKIYFKGRYFMLRVTDKNNDESTYGFETPSKPACKHLWKCCVEHHAFFRLVQVSPTAPDIFALGSRFRYSGRTEKQAVCDAQMKIRTPPSFSRTPSRRYQRRIVEGCVADPSPLDVACDIQQYPPSEIKHISVPQPAQNYDRPYACSSVVPMEVKKIDSPRSTRSAPWSQPHSKGLYNSSIPPSPRSVRSAGPRYRSSSVDSQSSNDSRSCKRRKHRSRITSDNESELSKSSSRCHRKHRCHRSKGNRKDSGSEHDSHTHDRRSGHRVKRTDSTYELVDSTHQWEEVQRKLSTTDGNANSVQQASVVSSRRSSSGPLHSSRGGGGGSEAGESEASCRNGKHRRHRKHRSRSRSPSEAKSWISDELKRHLEFDLIDTTGMSESQLREIPYTIVQSNVSKQVKVKHNSHWNKSDYLQNDKPSSSPPPPYSPQITDVARMRGLRHNTNQSQVDIHDSSHNNSSMLPRMLDSLNISEFSNSSQSQHSMNAKIGSSAVYSNPNTMLGGLNNGIQDFSDYPRISHEHSDSGLGPDQECNYGSEKSSDSAKATAISNKSGEETANMYQPVSRHKANMAYNPHQFYYSHTNHNKTRTKPANKTVHKQDPNGRTGLCKDTSNLSYNAYSTCSISVKNRQANTRSSLTRKGSKLSSASYNLCLTDNNPSLRGSVRSVASSPPISKSSTGSGPLRVQYSGSSIATLKSQHLSDIDDNYSYRADRNRNYFREQKYSRRSYSSRSTLSNHLNTPSRSVSLEYILSPLIRSSYQYQMK